MVDNYVQTFTEIAKKEAFTNLEYYVETVKNTKIDINQGKLQSSDNGSMKCCYVQGEYNGKATAYYTENFDTRYIEDSVRVMKEIAELSDDTFEPISMGECRKYAEAEIEDECESNTDVQDELRYYENKIKAEYPEIDQINIHFINHTQQVNLMNCVGDKMEDSVQHVGLMIRIQAEKDGKVQTSHIGGKGRYKDNLDFQTMFQEAAREACDLLVAKPVISGKYSVVLKNHIICEMLSMYVKMFGADMVGKKISKFSDRLGNKVASDIVNLIEDPEDPDGIHNRRFDDEGIPTNKKDLIKNGILQTFLYNRKEAKLAGVKSTGNGFKTDYKSQPETHVTNLRLVGEAKSRKDLLHQMNEGLYITSCDGMFAGANVVSGDFSLISKGYIIRNGRQHEAVNQITIAGNFYEMLHNIEGIGQDYLVEGGTGGAFIAPSIYVNELVVSGL